MPFRTLMPDGTIDEGFAEREIVDALHKPTGNKEPLIVTAIEAVGRKMSGGPEVGTGIREDGTMFTLDRESRHAVWISSAAASPARTFPSPGNEPDSPAPDLASSTSSCESQTSLFGPEGMPSLRTYPDSFHLTQEEISPSFSRRWPNSGFWTGPGESWTAVTSECHREGAASSSLQDVLEDSVAPKYFLSPRAAAGILRRAEKRGKELPRHLKQALATIAEATVSK